MDPKAYDDWLMERLDRIESRLANIEVTLSEQHISLQTHMRRSDALEALENATRAEMKPLLLRDAAMAQLMRYVTFAVSLAGAVYAVVKVAEAFGAFR